MTEQEWLHSNDPDPMWRHLEVSDPPPPLLRRSRLLACAFARFAWHEHDEQGKQIIESMERYADGNERLEDFSALMSVYDERVENEADPWRQAAGNCILGLWTARHENYPLRFAVTEGKLALAACQQSDDVWKSTQIPQICEAIRDIFGNPFRPLGADPVWLGWNGGTVPRIAQAIYKDRDFGLLKALADALEDAGCTNPEILDHCRGAGEHVRGCWVVDMLQGKS